MATKSYHQHYMAARVAKRKSVVLARRDTLAKTERLAKDVIGVVGWVAVGTHILTQASSPREIRKAIQDVVLVYGTVTLVRTLRRSYLDTIDGTLSAQKLPRGKPRPKPGPPPPPPDDDDPEREYPGPRKRP